MCFLRHDERHLQRALILARAAAGFASPNPAVGCVLVREDEVLGEGAHCYDNQDHAEIVALKQAAARGLSAQGATAYVTLEPCAHHGRTAPCADALIAAGIARCVVATIDPNPRVRGAGLAKLRAAGVAVVLAEPASAEAHEARQLNDAFAFFVQHGRPFVTLKAAVSADGKLAPPLAARTARTPHWLTGEAARADVQQLRHRSDAILTGVGTVLADDPSLTDRSGLAQRRPLLRVVLDAELRTPPDSKLATSAAGDVLIFCSAEAAANREAALRACGVDVFRLPGDRRHLDLPSVLAKLAARNLTSVLLEAGSTLNGSFLREGLVDKVVLYASKTELGPDALPFAEGVASLDLLQQQLQHVERAAFPHGSAEDIRISGYLHDPWAGVEG